MDLRDLKPFLPDMTEVLTVAVREIVASAYSRPATTPAGPDFLGGTVPSLNQGQHRCPYCATKDVLAPLHADLIRGAAVGPELQGVYQRLAQGKCREALAILDVIDGIVDDTHPEGDGCPLCIALEDLRLAIEAAGVRLDRAPAVGDEGLRAGAGT